jgi:hypothetical protein
MPEWPLVALEIRGAARALQVVRLVLLGIAAPLLSLWPYIGSPYVPSFAAAFLVLEPLYNTMLFIWPNQLTGYAVLPVRWESYLRAKGIAAVLITLAVAALFVTATAYMQPAPPTAHELAGCLLYLLSVMFPLLSVGTVVSRQQPRPATGIGLEDIAAGLVMLFLLGVASLPYVLVHAVPWGSYLLIAYTILAAIIWWFSMLPWSARHIQEEIPELWHTTRTLSS